VRRGFLQNDVMERANQRYYRVFSTLFKNLYAHLKVHISSSNNNDDYEFYNSNNYNKRDINYNKRNFNSKKGMYL